MLTELLPVTIKIVSTTEFPSGARTRVVCEGRKWAGVVSGNGRAAGDINTSSITGGCIGGSDGCGAAALVIGRGVDICSKARGSALLPLLSKKPICSG